MKIKNIIAIKYFCFSKKMFEKIIFLLPNGQLYYGIYGEKITKNMCYVYAIQNIKNLNDLIEEDIILDSLIKNYNLASNNNFQSIMNKIKNKIEEKYEKLKLDCSLVTSINDNNLYQWYEDKIKIITKNEELCNTNKFLLRDIYNIDLDTNEFQKQMIQIFICGNIDYYQKLMPNIFFLNRDISKMFNFNTNLFFYKDLYEKYLSGNLTEYDLKDTKYTKISSLEFVLSSLYILQYTQEKVVQNLKKYFSKFKYDNILEFIIIIKNQINGKLLSKNSLNDRQDVIEECFSRKDIVVNLNDFILKKNVITSVCLEKSVLFKIICDNYNIPCKLQIGLSETLDNKDISNHVWNKIIVNDKKYLVDIKNDYIGNPIKNMWLKKGKY